MPEKKVEKESKEPKTAKPPEVESKKEEAKPEAKTPEAPQVEPKKESTPPVRRNIREVLGAPPKKLRKNRAAVDSPSKLPLLPEDVDPTMAERVTKLNGVRIYHFADGTKYQG